MVPTRRAGGWRHGSLAVPGQGGRVVHDASTTQSRPPDASKASAAQGPQPPSPLRLAIEFLTDAPPRLGRQQTVTALKGPECSSELGMLSMLCSPPAHSLPLLAPLTSPPHCIVGPSDPDADGAQGQAGLNAEQLKVLRVVASWQLHDDVSG